MKSICQPISIISFFFLQWNTAQQLNYFFQWTTIRFLELFALDHIFFREIPLFFKCLTFNFHCTETSFLCLCRSCIIIEAWILDCLARTISSTMTSLAQGKRANQRKASSPTKMVGEEVKKELTTLMFWIQQCRHRHLQIIDGKVLLFYPVQRFSQ